MNNEIIELNILKQQLQEVEAYLNEIEKRILEMQQSIYDLENFKDRKEKDEILIPIVPGVFSKGEIKDKEKILIGVGGNVVIESSLDHAIEIINKNLNELVKQRNDFLNEAQKILNKINDLELSLQKKMK